MKYLLPLFIIVLSFGCTETEESNATYFGGKILNPKTNFVTVFNHKGAIDTLYLKKDNTFLGKLENINEGLYYFKHGPEHQYIYLEPKDSLLVRLNTLDFDESIVYSGTNAGKNNTLLNVFLQNENEIKKLRDLSKLNAEEYKSKIDEVLAAKERNIEEYKRENPKASSKYLNILTIANTYPVYSKIEEYLISHRKSNEPEEIKKSLYEHRNKVQMDLDSIMFYYPYSNYVMTKIYNDTYQQGHKNNTNEFTVALLHSIDKNIHSEDLKNVYLRQATISHFYDKSSCNINSKAFFTFFQLNTSIEDKKQVQRLLNDAKTLPKGNKMSSFNVVDYAGVTQDISTLIKNKNSVIYFRNPEHFSDEWVTSRLNYLINNNKNTSFFVINITDDKDYRVKNLDIKYQYQTPEQGAVNQLITSKYPRTVLVNNKGIIVNGFGALSSRKINTQIASINN